MKIAHRKILEAWTETEVVWHDEHGRAHVRRVTCCCEAPGSTREGCAIVAGDERPCRCYCHSDPRKPGNDKDA